METNNFPVAIIGAGPIGLAAAAHLLKRGETPLLFEAGRTVGAAVLQWGHVRLFSPWRYLIDREAAALLVADGWEAPDPAAYPTGQELVEDYLAPLANTPRIKPHLHLDTRVVAVSRQAIVVLVLAASSLAWLILYVLIYGSAYGAFSPLRASVMADHFGRRAYGAITAVQGIPVALCAGLGPLAAGWLYDWLHHYELAFWLCAGAFLLAATGLALAPQPNERHDGTTQAHSMTGEDMVESRG